jgi:thiamine kinase-like enzyme
MLAQPCVRAWAALDPGHPEPKWIERIKGTPRAEKQGWKLLGAGPGGSTVIAKRCREETAILEGRVYERLLPALRLNRLHFFGAVRREGESWLFIEDAGGEELAPHLPEHRALAVRWLAVMHSSAVQVSASAGLPHARPDRYLSHLRGARANLLAHLGTASARAEERAPLESLVARCDRLEADWDRLASHAMAMPNTLVHGDFVAKNLRLRSGPSGMVLVPFDWEHAGWGTPAIDLGTFAMSCVDASPELAAYCATARSLWPEVREEVVFRAAASGRILRWLAALDWFCLALDRKWPPRVHINLRHYDTQVARSIDAWERG